MSGQFPDRKSLVYRSGDGAYHSRCSVLTEGEIHYEKIKSKDPFKSKF